MIALLSQSAGSSGEGERVTRSGVSLNSPVTPLSSEKKQEVGSTKKKRGRKRKAEKSSTGSFKISDFMDSQVNHYTV